MNDGAMNRVPGDFFTQTWMVLDKCHGLTIGSHCLPRDPTVFDKTPGEFNFALAVESFLGLFTDPAQRQIAVEILALTFEAVQKLDNDGKIMEGNVDIPAIMEDAQSTFWSTWVEKNNDALTNSPLFKDGQLDYETHKDLARHLFYDLPLDGPESTYTYLTNSLTHLLPKPV